MTSKGYKKTARIVKKNESALNPVGLKPSRPESHATEKKIRHFLSNLPEEIRIKIMEFIPYVIRCNVYQYKYFRDKFRKNELIVRLKSKLLRLPKNSSTKLHIVEYLDIAMETMQLMINEKVWKKHGVLWSECNSQLDNMGYARDMLIWYIECCENDFLVCLEDFTYSWIIEEVVFQFFKIFKYRLKLNSKWHKTHENIFKLYGLFIA